MSRLSNNLHLALHHLQSLTLARLESHFGKDGKAVAFTPPQYPSFQTGGEGSFDRFLADFKPDDAELITLLTALVPHVYPSFFDTLLAPFLPKGGDFPELGGIKSQNSRGMMPTGETVLFLLAGNDLDDRLLFQKWLRDNRLFNADRLLTLDKPLSNEPAMSGRLTIDSEFVEWFTTERVLFPKLSAEFPAQYISTQLEWKDLVLDPQTQLSINDLDNWLRHSPTLLHDWGMSRKVKPGFRVLFYGPPGTGKTLTATLLGKYAQLPVFRIDLSMIVSKYIGETEKNLSTLFDKAENKNWILFFDEADALFGKRTSVRDAHDKYANQEVSYLLQRIENYAGLVILASNFKGNMDEAFTRRFNAMVHFPVPKFEERLKLWRAAFPTQVTIESVETVLPDIARRYELTGANIVNIAHYCCLDLLGRNVPNNLLTKADILRGIQRELAKEDRVA